MLDSPLFESDEMRIIRVDMHRNIDDEKEPVVYRHLKRLLERYSVLMPIEAQMVAAYQLLKDGFESGGKLLIAGNGGSSADSGHIVGELMKGFLLKRPLDDERYAKALAVLQDDFPEAADMLQGALPAISLSQNGALLTAVSNDQNAQLIFAQQLVAYGQPGDVFWGISTSGNARNVLIAMRLARAWGMKTLGLTGETGGAMKEACDVLICVPGTSTAEVQELHLPVYHTLCAMVEEHFFGEKQTS